jgi:hypothetical protein
METQPVFATPDRAADGWIFVKGLIVNYLSAKLELQSNMVLRMVASGRLGYMTARKRVSFCGRLVWFTTCQRPTSLTKPKAKKSTTPTAGNFSIGIRAFLPAVDDLHVRPTNNQVLPDIHALLPGVWTATFVQPLTPAVMPSAAITEHMPSRAVAVFDLLHDYSRRLEWDTLLREARFTRGNTAAGVGATTLCVGKPLFGIIGIETSYLTFNRGVIAAVDMINHPPFFETFAASIRHKDTGEGSSVTYRFNFRARPRLLRWLLEPIMLVVLRHETRQRLRALSRFLAATPK